MCEDVVWKKWWRHVEGEVSLDNGFQFNEGDDYWYFDVDPNDSWQEQIPEEGDSRYMHVDELFDNKEDAVEAAKEWLEEAEDELIGKQIALGVYKRRCEECDDDY
jgi:hypothetical protein